MAGYHSVNKAQALLHGACEPSRHSCIPAQEGIE